MQKHFPVAEITIDRFSKKGNGLGRLDASHTVEIPFTCPSDIACVEIKRGGRKSKKGKLLTILKPSSDRIQPKCTHFGICGGCRLQHLPYEKQLDFKDSQIKEAFKGTLTQDASVHPTLPSQSIWNYRNKMEFSFSQDKEGQRFLGLMMENGRGKVLDLTECHLVAPWFMDCLKAVRIWWKGTELLAYHPHKNIGTLRTLTLRHAAFSGDRLVLLTVSGDPDYAISKKDLSSFVIAVRDALEPLSGDAALSLVLRIQQVAKGEPTNFYEMVLFGPDTLRESLEIQGTKYDFQISPTAFFQTNTKQAARLFEKVIELADLKDTDIVYDLYCGTGTLGIIMAKKVKQVLGIELSPESVLDAKANISANNIDNMNVISGAVCHVLSQIQKEKNFPPPNVLTLDPPRSGLDPKTLSLLLKLKINKIIYVSCNPWTQARDIEILVQNGYSIKQLQPVDQFPQTYHVENIAILEHLPDTFST